MNDKNWEDCLKNKTSRKIRADIQKAKSLIKTSKSRLDFFEQIKLDPSNANYIFEGYYTSVVEIIHAALISKGISINNHICIGIYLKEVLKNAELFLLFDGCRKKRNGITYYGKQLKFETAKTAIHACKIIIKEIKRLLKE